jgi:branched-chain amino acid transport system permease protein
MTTEVALQTLANSVVASGFYGIMAVGLALIFGVMRQANYAHGELFMVGAYAVWLLFSEGNWPFFPAVLAGIGIVAGIGILMERGIFRPARGNVVQGFIMSIGMIFILQVLVGRIWGVGLAKPVPLAFPGTLEILGAAIRMQRVIVIPIAFGSLGALWLFLSRVKLGRALRAVAQDPDAANLQGISINKMSMLAMAIAGAFAGLAGGLMAPIHQVTPYMGHAIVLTTFVVVIVGGVGSLQGAIVTAIIFGFLHTVVTTLIDATTAMMIGVLVMGIILAVRPKGLMGREAA